MTHHIRIILGLFAIALLSACVSTKTMETSNEFTKVDGPVRILLLEPDVQVSFIKTSEIREVRADWTELAETQILSEMEKQLAEKSVTFTEFDIDEASPREIQLVKLHEAVGGTIITHRYGYQPLPSKQDKFDWTLGPGVQTFAENHDADYALLIYARGEYASAGKVVTNILMTAAFGVSGSMGGQLAFASLIDLRTGDIVWFNVAQTGSGTDMREQSGAELLVQKLLTDIPL